VSAFEAVLRASATVASINVTMDDSTFTGLERVMGTVNGSAFVNFTVYYGSGIYPASFTPIATGTSAVVSSTLVSWETSTVANGAYTLRLEVEDSSSHAFLPNLTLSVGGSEAVSVGNGSVQTFVAPVAQVDAVRVSGGVDNDVYHLEMRYPNGTAIAISEAVTVFSTNQQMDVSLSATLTVNDAYALAIVTESGTSITMLANSSNPYADGNLSGNASLDLKFALIDYVTTGNLTFVDATTVSLSKLLTMT